MQEQQFKKIKTIFNSLQETYNKKESTFKDIQELLAPGTGNFKTSEDLENDKVNYQQLLDSEPVSYLDTTASGLYGGLINPASRWFDLDIDRTNPATAYLDDYTVGQALSQCKEFLYYLFARSNFYDAMAPTINEWGRYGCGVLLIEERAYDFIFFNHLTAGEFFLGIDQDGKYNKLGRTFRMNAQQMVEKFGKDKLPDNILQAYERGDNAANFEVNHLICPNDNTGIVPNMFKFMDIYWHQNNILRTSGFRSNPIVVFPWERKNTRTIYPMGIGEKILGDTKELQQTVKALSMHKAYLANPALALHTSLGKKPVLPGARYYTDQDPTKLASEIFRVAPYISEMEDSRTRLLDKIRKMTFADLLLLFAQQQKGTMTAREVSAIVNEQMTLLAPIYLHAKEALQCIFDRVIDICVRRGAFPATEYFDPRQIRVEFMSAIAKSQRMAEAGSIQDLILYVSQLAQIKPAALDYLNEDAIVKDIAGRLGNYSKINSDEEVAAIRQAQAEQQQAMMAQQQQAEQMKIAKDASKAKIEPNNLLGQQVLQGGGAIPPSNEEIAAGGGSY